MRRLTMLASLVFLVTRKEREDESNRNKTIQDDIEQNERADRAVLASVPGHQGGGRRDKMKKYKTRRYDTIQDETADHAGLAGAPGHQGGERGDKSKRNKTI